jgi:hypothetical protein
MDDIFDYCPPQKLPKVAEMEAQFDILKKNWCEEHTRDCNDCDDMDCKYNKKRGDIND